VITITYFDGDQHNVKNGQLIDYVDIEEMASHFKEPVKGGKHHAYFVRGGCEPMHRKDANIDHSSIIVIDGDMSRSGDNAPRPRDVHDAMCRLGYSHFIYTSHSHSVEKNKFRVVVQSERKMVKSDLGHTCKELMRLLWNEGVDIKYVDEMRRWSQPWFIPSRDDPEDGLFEYYGWFNGSLFPVYSHSEDGDDSTPNPYKSDNESKNWVQRISEIVSAESFHPNMMAITYGMAKDGMDRSIIIAICQQVMSMQVPSDEKRMGDWQKRYDDIPRIVSGAFLKIDEDEPDIDLSGITLGPEKCYTLPRPPGLYGKLCDDVYNMAPYKYKEVAFVTSTGILAGIVGRKFNVSGSGLNVYMTLIADTGLGKDTIDNIITNVYSKLNSNIGISPSFLGSGDYTGPAGLAKSLLNARCQVAIFSEAGFLLDTKSGNREGLTRWILQLYGKSGAKQSKKGETYSDEKNSIPFLHSPCLSIISESTPSTLIAAFSKRDSISTGELPRQSIFRVTGGKPYLDINFYKNDLRDELFVKLSYLFKKCKEDQTNDKPNVYDIEPCDERMKEDWSQFNRHLVDLENEAEDSNLKIMCSRAFLKALKYSALATVLNRDSVEMQWEEWEWGKSMVEYELSTVQTIFASGSMLNDVCVKVVAPTIFKILVGGYKDPKKRVSDSEMKKGVFTKYALGQALKNNDMLIKLNDDPLIRSRPISGLDKALSFMVENEFLTDVSNSYIAAGSRVGAKRYKVTPIFKTIFDQ